MGNNSQKSTIKGGLIIHVDKISYIGGEIVSGNIFIHIEEAILGAQVILGFKGKESADWSESSGNRDSRHFKGDHCISNFKSLIHTLDASQDACSYTIPFSFKLPDRLPGSFSYEHDGVHAFIKYEMRVKLLPVEGKALLKNKCPIEIKQVAESIQQDINRETIAEISTWCCCSRGKVGIKARFAKDYYTPDEVAIIYADINNSLSKLKVVRVKASFSRWIRLNGKENRILAMAHLNLVSNDHTHFHHETLLEVVSESEIPEGIKNESSEKLALSPTGQSFQIALDLTKVRNQVIGHFTTKGKIVECIYNLNVEAEMDGTLMCCGDSTSVSSDVMVYPTEYAPAPLPSPPENWDPEIVGQVDLAWDPRYEVQPSPSK